MSDSDQTEDAVFTTLTCGIDVDAITMTRSGARAKDDYDTGWEWRFDLTVWDLAETSLKMLFGPWSGPSALSAAGNMRYSADDGTSWTYIDADNDYPAIGADIGTGDSSDEPGRQIQVLVQMKLPRGTLTGSYGTSYGILTE